MDTPHEPYLFCREASDTATGAVMPAGPQALSLLSSSFNREYGTLATSLSPDAHESAKSWKVENNAGFALLLKYALQQLRN